MPAFRNDKKIITTEDFAEGLWVFCKKRSTSLYDPLTADLKKAGVEIDDEAGFLIAKEIVIINLWTISKTLRAEKEILDLLHRRYIMGHKNIDGSEDEKIHFAKQAQVKLHDRYGKYYSAWNDKEPGQQWVLASTMLEQMVGKNRHVLLNPFIATALISHILAAMKRILQLRGEFDVTGKAA